MMNQSCVVAQIDSIFGIIIELNLSQWKNYLLAENLTLIQSLHIKSSMFSKPLVAQKTPLKATGLGVALFLMSI